MTAVDLPAMDIPADTPVLHNPAPGIALREAPLLGRRAVVTGGTRGIGRAIATTFAAAGATVCAVASSMRPELAELEAELQGYTPDSLVAAADVSVDGEVQALFSDLAERWGPRGGQPAGLRGPNAGTAQACIDVLVNNAGVVSHHTLDDLDPAEWDRVLNTNLGGLYRACRAATPLMDRGGSIINIVSAVATVGMVGRTHYTASKAGMVGFTRSLCKELGPRGIRVNAIAPGLVETDQMAGLSPEQRARYEKMAALEALGQPLDIARAAVFFAAGYSGFVTGAVLVVDGGI